MNSESSWVLVNLFRNPKIQLIGIDADDTLWYDSRYFRRLEELLVQLAGFAGLNDSEVLKQLASASEESSNGERGFAEAMTITANRLNLGPSIMTELESAIHSFLAHPVEILPGVREALTALGKYRLVLITKGHVAEQQHKLNESGLSEFFEKVFIQPRKNSEQLAVNLRQLGVRGLETMIIGNSIRHDIIPAIENGATAIWINHPENYSGRNAKLPVGVCEVDGWGTINRAFRRALSSSFTGE